MRFPIPKLRMLEIVKIKKYGVFRLIFSHFLQKKGVYFSKLGKTTLINKVLQKTTKKSLA